MSLSVLAFLFSITDHARLASQVSQRYFSTEATELYDKAIRHCHEILSEQSSLSKRVITDAGALMIG